jgi:hypothetical protein
MLTSKRQEWILQMIKGPEIAPVSNTPGHYTSKSTISITACEQQVTIRPTDVIDLSNPEFLVVQTDAGEHSIAWNRISSLDFEEQGVGPAASQRQQFAASAHRVSPFHLGKKAV